MRKLSMFIIALMTCVASRATLRLPHVLSDGLVLQQQDSARLWGWAKLGEARMTITIYLINQ
jgi:sialate O-acetylesterase